MQIKPTNKIKNITNLFDKKKHYFFDLDGTLTDPREGITKCISYALTKLNATPPPLTELEQYIGPPLRKSFAELLNSSDTTLIEGAMSLYRERYATQGIFENKLIECIPETLSLLRANDTNCYVLTSKPHVYARQIVEHFKIDQYFKDVFGPELDGTRAHKVQLFAYALKKLNIKGSDSVVIGDRKDDIIAGKSQSAKTVGVLCGFGTEEELRGCNADVIAELPDNNLLTL